MSITVLHTTGTWNCVGPAVIKNPQIHFLLEHFVLYANGESPLVVSSIWTMTHSWVILIPPSRGQWHRHCLLHFYYTAASDISLVFYNTGYGPTFEMILILVLILPMLHKQFCCWPFTWEMETHEPNTIESLTMIRDSILQCNLYLSSLSQSPTFERWQAER